MIVLNAFAEMLHMSNMTIQFNFILNYFFHILKGNRIIFDKVKNRGEVFLDQIKESILYFYRLGMNQFDEIDNPVREVKANFSSLPTSKLPTS